MDHGNMTWSLFPSAQWTNDALRVKATRVAHGHWEWWKTIRSLGFPEATCGASIDANPMI